MFRLRADKKRTAQASAPTGKGESPPTSSRETEAKRVEEKAVPASFCPMEGNGSPSREQIAIHAYHLWLARGKPAGNGQEDWLEAERQLTATT